VNKAEPENQIFHGHQQECRADTDLVRTMQLSAGSLFEVPVQIDAINTADTEIIANKSIRKMVP
jgi:hypothetical protein